MVAKLRPVAPDERAESRVPKSVSEAAKSGTTRQLMEQMRDRIAVAIDDPNTPARDLAALTKRLAETVREIEAIDARDREEGTESRIVADVIFNPAAV